MTRVVVGTKVRISSAIESAEERVGYSLTGKTGSYMGDLPYAVFVFNDNEEVTEHPYSAPFVQALEERGFVNANEISEKIVKERREKSPIDAKNMALSDFVAAIAEEFEAVNEEATKYPRRFSVMSNPYIELDDGGFVWGIECWWGTEEHYQAALARAQKANSENSENFSVA